MRENSYIAMKVLEYLCFLAIFSIIVQHVDAMVSTVRARQLRELIGIFESPVHRIELCVTFFNRIMDRHDTTRWQLEGPLLNGMLMVC